MNEQNQLKNLFKEPVSLNGNFISKVDLDREAHINQEQTKEIFSDKWGEVEGIPTVGEFFHFQQDWFLSLYGFETEDNMARYLRDKAVIVDTGCGLGYKAAWFARLAPHAIVLGVDISDSVLQAAAKYPELENLYFFQGDIADTGLKDGVVDFTVCDQVIMHTEDPQKTFQHLSDITSDKGEFACYVYSKKALPRELIDDYFRKATHDIPNDQMWELSSQLTELGKRLSELKVTIDSPDIPLLGIKGGTYDIQRFIYWNFLKCFWKEDWGFDLSQSTNYDWYAPSNAKRFSKQEFVDMATNCGMKETFMHEEEACYSGRFRRK
jgi:SAM-dependent methyltransferase